MEITTKQERNELLNDLEVALAKLPRVEMPVTHRFTKGMYIREIQIPAETMLTSMTHKTEHPFVLSKGKIMVTSDNEGSVIYEAPYTGITKAGTRRALHALTDVVWTTFHVTDETDVEKESDAEMDALRLQGDKLHNKYSKLPEREYRQKLKMALYRKGFPMELIDEFIMEKENED